MYENYFGLSEKPFNITPDPRFIYLSRRHREALAHLLYGMTHGGGFIQLTGEVGTGKTTLSRYLLARIGDQRRADPELESDGRSMSTGRAADGSSQGLEQLPDNVDVALILNPKLSARELVATLCDELEIDYPLEASLKLLVDRLNERLLANYAAGRRSVVMIDEAQTLSSETLEQVRLLTNLETATHKLLQIVLLGQPELRQLLQRPELRQLAQRITARYHLEPLTLEESRAYLRHRLAVAGVERRLFSEGAVRLLHRRSGGIPRLLNVIADRALLGAYAQDCERVDRGIVRRAAIEVQGERSRAQLVAAGGWRPEWRVWLLPLIASLVIAVLLGIGQWQGALRESMPWSVLASWLAPSPAAKSEIAAAPSPPEQPIQTEEAVSGHAETEREQIAPRGAANSNLGDQLSGPNREPVKSAETATASSVGAEVATSSGPSSPRDGSAAARIAAELSASIKESSTSGPLAVDAEGEATLPLRDDASPLVAVETPKPPAEPLSLNEWLTLSEPATPFADLFTLWGQRYERLAGADPCSKAQRAGLRCWVSQGKLDDLMSYDRPVVLELFSREEETETRRQRLLRASDGRYGELTAAAQQARFDWAEIERHWRGDFLMLWQPPPELRGPYLASGQRDPAVLWLRESLAQALNLPTQLISRSDRYDGGLRDQVLIFQVQEGLDQDGIAGRQTFIRLNDVLGRPLPRLSVLSLESAPSSPDSIR